MRSSVGTGRLQRLRDAWQRAVRGRPCTVVVRGPDGCAAAVPWPQHSQRRWPGRGRGPVCRAGYRRLAGAASTRVRGPSATGLRSWSQTTLQSAGGATLVLQLAGHLADVTPEGPRSSTSGRSRLRHVREIVADYVTPDVVDTVRRRCNAAREAGRARCTTRRSTSAREARPAQGRSRRCSHRSLERPACQRQGRTRRQRRPPPGHRRPASSRRSRRVPLARPGRLRRRGRAVVRRPRAPRRRAGCPAGGHQAARPRRCLRLGEVLGPTGRTPGCTPP